MKFNKLLVFACMGLAVALMVRCGGNGADKGNSKQVVITSSAADIKKGELLAAQYCQSCHQLPHPSLLDKATWRNSVLPVMGLYLGTKYHVSDSILNTQLDNMTYLPQTPVIDSLEWRYIINYYVNKAPGQLPVAQRAAPLKELPFFKIIPAPAEWVSSSVLTSYVKIDDSVKPHRLIVVDGVTNKVIVLDNKVSTINSSTMSGAIVNMVFQKDGIVATTLGKDLWANDAKNGNVKEINIDNTGKVAVAERLIVDRLGRPVATTITDLNQDGQPDYLVAQFGKMTGKLSWFELPEGKKKEHVLRDKPGCVKTVIEGHNIWALFAQGDEGLFKYTNDGKGNFAEKRVLSFPPSYGSTYFELVDINSDGLKDVVYTCGDNGDYSQIPKPYHGIYIYLNTGNDTFVSKYFYPMNGCYKAIVKDFDSDGKLDIAAISQFPGGANRNESFIYLKGKGGLDFQPYTLPPGTPLSNALTMDAGDIDGDGKTDLLIGNGFVGPNKADKQPLFIVLKNIK